MEDKKEQDRKEYLQDLADQRKEAEGIDGDEKW